MKEENKVVNTISSILKSIIIILIIGIIMFALSLLGAKVYKINSYGRVSGMLFSYIEKLNPIFGILGILFYIMINCIGFKLLDYFMKKFKNYYKVVGIILYTFFCIFINILMTIVYFDLFGEFKFDNKILNFFNIVIVQGGFIVFPIIFTAINIHKKVVEKKKH